MARTASSVAVRSVSSPSGLMSKMLRRNGETGDRRAKVKVEFFCVRGDVRFGDKTVVEKIPTTPVSPSSLSGTYSFPQIMFQTKTP